MATMNIQTRKFADLSEAPSVSGGDMLIVHDGNGVKKAAANSLMPTGAVMPFAGTTAPAGFLLCNGQAVSRSTYANLFAVCGTLYGTGDGSTTFNLPNMNGKVAQGAGAGFAQGAVGGVAKQRLAFSNLPGDSLIFINTSFSHPVINPDHYSTGLWGGHGDYSGSIPLNQTTQQFSQDLANMPPYLALNYIIKT